MKVDTYWEDYWKKEGKQGQVFINKNGDKPAYLSQLWSDYFNNINDNSSIIDIACGSGSIFLDIPTSKKYNLYGADISQKALDSAKKNIKHLTTMQCPATDIPVTDQYFDNVVSQFGIEYSGFEGFIEAIRILKVNGKFCFVVHYLNGYIDKQNKGKLDGALLVKESNFIDIAKELTTALYSNKKENIESTHNKFSVIEPTLLAYKNNFPDGVHAHLYDGFRKLLTNMSNYKCNDIIEWLQSMNKEVEKNIIRLQQMRNAALSEEQVNELKVKLNTAGVSEFNYKKFYTTEQKDPIGWLVYGTK